MSYGTTSYPRTDAGGRGPGLIYYNALAALREGTAKDPEFTAKKLIEALLAISESSNNHKIMIVRAIESRNLLFSRLMERVITENHYTKAMAVCAKHWQKVYLPDLTGLAHRIEAAKIQLENATSRWEIIRAKETAGTLATLYQISAHLGRDISATHLEYASFIENSKYQITVQDQELIYMECGASYNVNLFVQETIPGCDQPLIMVGEAKGGESSYGYVKGPNPLLHRFNLNRINQKNKLYPVTRAHYMCKNRANTHIGELRRSTGKAILLADEEESLVFIVARGNIVNGEFIQSLEKIE